MELKVLMIDCVANSRIQSPELVPYDHLGLFKKKTMSKGLLIKTEYYRVFENDVYSDLYVEEIHEHHYNGVYYTGTTTTVKWYDIYDEVGYQNEHNKIFTIEEIRDFGKKKRQVILSTVEMYTLGQIGLENGTDLMSSLAFETKNYVDGVSPTFICAAVSAFVGVKPYLSQNLANTINAIFSDI